MNFKDVIDIHGYPFISKEASGIIHGARKYLQYLINDEQKLSSIGSLEDILNSNDLINVVESRQQDPGARYLANMLGMIQRDGTIKSNGTKETLSYYNMNKYKFLLLAPFEINSRCCDIMKKNLSHKYISKTNRVPITGQLAYESELRKQQWIINGCNGFNMSSPRSNPMAFWMEQDVLQYIHDNNIKIASVYGDICCYKDNLWKDVYKTTACQRTGCIFCGFGAHHDKYPNRFELIDIVSNKNLREYVMRGGHFCDDGLWRPSDDGLGYWFVIQYINIHGRFSINIPEFDKYEMLYGNESTNKYLYSHLM